MRGHGSLQPAAAAHHGAVYVAAAWASPSPLPEPPLVCSLEIPVHSLLPWNALGRTPAQTKVPQGHLLGPELPIPGSRRPSSSVSVVGNGEGPGHPGGRSVWWVDGPVSSLGRASDPWNRALGPSFQSGVRLQLAPWTPEERVQASRALLAVFISLFAFCI